MTIEFLMSQSVLEQQVIPEIVKYPNLGLDIESRGLNPREDKLILVQLGWGDNIWVFDARRINLNPLFNVLEEINPLFVGHNIKFDLKFLKHNYGFSPERVYCTQIAHVILNNGLIPNPYVSLRELVKKHADVMLNKDVRKSFVYTYGEVTEEQINYAADDVRYLSVIFENQLKKLKEDNLVRTAQLEFALTPTVVDMELTGVPIDQDKWLRVSEKNRVRVSEAEMRIAEVIGDISVQSSFTGTPKLGINPNSPKQMLDQFHKFGIDIPDTREDTLRKVDHPLARALLDHRKASKLVSTYGPNFLDHVDSDGRIRSEFNQVGTETARFNSSNPNLQNIPDDEDFRSCFISGDGNLLLTADYSQVELKTAAVLSRDEVMLNEYNRKDADLHTLTASRVYDIPPEEVTHDQRSKAKNVNFGILYGISKYGLYRKFGIPYDEGEKLIKGHRKTYPQLTKYMNRKSLEGLEKGYITTAIGRRRYFTIPPMTDKDYYRKVGSIKRMSGNTPVQGGASEIMKRSLIDVHDAIEGKGDIVMTVHDELSVICPEENFSEVLSSTIEAMSRAGEKILDDSVEWEVDVVFGDCWKKA